MSSEAADSTSPPPPSSSSSPNSSTARAGSRPSQSQPRTPSAASYFSYPVTHVVSGLYRRLTDGGNDSDRGRGNGNHHKSATMAYDPSSGLYTPKRTASPFQPPPLTPLTLSNGQSGLHQILTRALAEEIRLLVPPRLQLVHTWRLAYSLDRDGASLSTLYEKCRDCSDRSQRAGYVLVVRDASAGDDDGGGSAGGGSVFGAYLTDAPHPRSHYYGTGECFLWRASVLSSAPLLKQFGLGAQNAALAGAGTENGESNGNGSGSGDGEKKAMPSDDLLELAGLPPPPSADTTNISTRSTTLRGERRPKGDATEKNGNLLKATIAGETTYGKAGSIASGTSTPERIRFKAFPYSGVNDYMMFCETGFLSVGGGDGHFGLWLDDSFEKGVSAPCLTFGNEPLSDEGEKFDILGVEIWYIGS